MDFIEDRADELINISSYGKLSWVLKPDLLVDFVFNLGMDHDGTLCITNSFLSIK